MKRALKKIGNKMPLYEHVFISRQDLSNTQAEGLVEHFGVVLQDNGGTVVNSEYWGLKTMAYKINKNRKGHYAMMRTDAPLRGCSGDGTTNAAQRRRDACSDY